MEAFTRLLDYKSYEIRDKYAVFYPRSIELVDLFFSRMGLKSIDEQIREERERRGRVSRAEEEGIKEQVVGRYASKLEVSEHLIDHIVRYLIVVQQPGRKNEKFKLTISAEIMKGKAVNFSNLVAVLEQFEADTSKWQDAIHIIFRDIQNLQKSPSLSQSIPNPIHYKGPQSSPTNPTKGHPAKYFESIEQEHLARVDCLGCTRHFIYNMNICDLSVNKSRFFTLEKVEKMAEFE